MKPRSFFYHLAACLLCGSGLTLEAQGELVIRVIDQNLTAIHDTGSSILATGHNGDILRSLDEGDSFETILQGDPLDPLFALEKAGDTVIAGGRNGLMFRSTDGGLTWDEAMVGPILGDVTGLAGNGAGRWVAVGADDDRPAILVSADDGETWTANTGAVDAANLFDVVWHAGSESFIAVGGDGFFNGKILTSSDGTDWESVENLPADTGQLRFVAVNEVGWILAGGENGTLVRSTGEMLAFSAVPGVTVDERLTVAAPLSPDGDWVVGGAARLLLKISHDTGATILSEAQPPVGSVAGLAFLPETDAILVAGKFSGDASPDPVLPDPPETSSPENLAVFEEDDAYFYVSPIGEELTIEWQRSTDGGQNWVAINGAVGLSYSEENVTLAMDGTRFRVVVSNPAGSVTSDAAVLTVREMIAPSQSRFSQAVTGFETAGYLFLPDGKFRRVNSAGKWVEGEWLFTRESSSDEAAVVQFIDDTTNPVLRNLYLTFENQTSATYREAEGGENLGRISLDFDFFGLERSPETGRRSSIWLGEFDDTHFDHGGSKQGWIKHDEHGWLYTAGNGSPGGIWFWDDIQQDWLWTKYSVYPFFFSHERQQWTFYERGGTPGRRDFFYYDEEKWEEVK